MTKITREILSHQYEDLASSRMFDYFNSVREWIENQSSYCKTYTQADEVQLAPKTKALNFAGSSDCAISA